MTRTLAFLFAFLMFAINAYIFAMGFWYELVIINSVTLLLGFYMYLKKPNS